IVVETGAVFVLGFSDAVEVIGDGLRGIGRGSADGDGAAVLAFNVEDGAVAADGVDDVVEAVDLALDGSGDAGLVRGGPAVDVEIRNDFQTRGVGGIDDGGGVIWLAADRERIAA